jgi:RHS repeat-associated protein
MLRLASSTDAAVDLSMVDGAAPPRGGVVSWRAATGVGILIAMLACMLVVAGHHGVTGVAVPRSLAMSPGEAEAARARSEFVARDRWLASAAARAQRAESRMAFHGLPDAAAERLLMRDYGADLRSAGFNPAASVAAAGTVVRYLDSHRALVSTRHGLEVLNSSVPLRARRSGALRPVDLRLRAVKGGFASINPLENVSIASRLGGGVALGSAGLRLVPVGRDIAGRAGGSQSVFFGNIGLDEDASVTPTVSGVDLSTVLRSVLSPEQVAYRVVMPVGVSLRQVDGAAVISGRGITVRVLPPSARDAQGQVVPVTMSVRGDELQLQVAHRQRSFAYPIFVDPTVTIKHCCGEWRFEGPEWKGSKETHREELMNVGTPGVVTAEIGGYSEYEESAGEIYENNWGYEHGFREVRAVVSGISFTGPELFEAEIESGCRRWKSSVNGPPPSTLIFPSKQFEKGAYCVEDGREDPGHVEMQLRKYFGTEGPYCPAGHCELKENESLSIGAALIYEETPGLHREPEEEYGKTNPSSSVPTPCEVGDPVNCATGNLSETQTDLSLGGRGIPLGMTRTYNAQAAATQKTHGLFGYGWSASYAEHLNINSEEGLVTVVQANGSTATFVGTPGLTGELTAPGWVQATLVRNESGTYTYTLPSQRTYLFSSAGLLLSETDRSGNTTTMNRNGEGRLESVTDAVGRKLTFAYNVEGEVESITDPMGHKVKYTYEGGNLATVTEAGESSARWQFKYDSSHRLVKMIDGRGGETTNEYNASNQVVSQTDPASRTITLEYSPQHTKITNHATSSVTEEQFTEGNELESITRGAGTASAVTETFTYNGVGERTSETNGNEEKTEYTYGEGNMLTKYEPEGHTTTWTYDKTHDVLTQELPGGEKTTYTRNSAGEVEKESRPAPGETTQETKYVYGTHGELESMTNPLGQTWKYEYDAHGDRTGETDPEGNKRTWEFNEDSQVIAMVSPRGNAKGAEPSKYTTKIERDAQGRPLKITDPLGHTTKYTYDGDGNVETITDGNSNKTKYTYNADNELTKTEEPNGAVSETGYDGAGQVTSRTDGNKHMWKYVRNAVEEVTEEINPRERKTVKEYDKAGNLTKITDPLKRETTNTYNGDNRLTKTTYSDGKTHTKEYEYNKDGDLTTMKDATGTTKYTYDQLDRETQSENGHKEVVKYEYNLGNQTTKITYPNGKAVTQSFNKDGELEKVTDWSSHATTFAYSPDDELTTITYPSETKDEDKYTYNEADEISEIAMLKGAETLASLAYVRDGDGQVKSITSKGLPGEEKLSYEYDANSRLHKSGTTEYEYDAANDPTKLGSSSYTYSSADELETGTGFKYAYNEAGQRTKATPTTGSATTYEYDQAGNLITVERPVEGKTAAIKDTYTYNGQNLRASQTVASKTTYFAWNEAQPIAQLLSDGTNSYIYGPGDLPIEQINTSTGAVLYLHHDQQGSTRLLTGSTGKAEGKCSYSPYGTPTCEGTGTTPLGFDAQYTSSDTGLIYMRARVYDPATAQFLSVDPFAAVTGAPYSYAGDSPINEVDPTGLSSTAEGLGEGGIPCFFPLCGPPPAVEETLRPTLEKVEHGVERVWNEITEAEEPTDEGESELKKKEAEREHCGNPANPPGSKFKWKGKGEPGSEEGSWYDEETGEYLRPDFKPSSHGPHYDYRGPDGARYRIYPDGRIEGKP